MGITDMGITDMGIRTYGFKKDLSTVGSAIEKVPQSTP